MAVPADIRAVPRPKNTIVDDSGRDGSKRYAVRERASTKYVSGGNPQPRNGKVVGHIINYEYVPVDTEIKSAPAVPDMLSYGSSALVHSVTRDIEKDLLAVYDPADVFAIMSVATLRVIKPSITANRMSTHYNRCFVCKDYPGAALSRNSVGKLFQKIGMDGNCRKLFYQRRMLLHLPTIISQSMEHLSRIRVLSMIYRHTLTKQESEGAMMFQYSTLMT